MLVLVVLAVVVLLVPVAVVLDVMVLTYPKGEPQEGTIRRTPNSIPRGTPNGTPRGAPSTSNSLNFFQEMVRSAEVLSKDR